MPVPAAPSNVSLGSTVKVGAAGGLATGFKVTALTGFNVDCINNTLTVFGGSPNPQAYDLAGVSTLTWTVSGNVYTLSLS
jgi:hypothetical protein